MARFLGAEAFQADEMPLELLPFRFNRDQNKNYLVSNMVGDFVRLSSDELDRLVDLRLAPGDGLYEKAYQNHLISRQGQIAQKQILAMRLRSRMSFLREPTLLHMFVVTLRCEHSCPYCQVSRQSTNRSRYDMSEETAEHALNIAFETPSKRDQDRISGWRATSQFSND